VRIFALVVDAFGGTGGISQYNRDLIAAWAELETVKQIVVLPRFAIPLKPPVPEQVIQHSPVASAPMYGIRALVHSVRAEQPDVVFCGHLHMMPLAVVISKLTGAPIWLQIHGLEAWKGRVGFTRWCIERASLVTAVSRHTRRLFLQWANVEPNRVLVLPNTVGEQYTNEVDRTSAKELFGLTGRRVLLTVSRLAKSERYKGHEEVIRCLPEIVERVRNLAYVIAGDGDMRSELEELVRREKLEDIVFFTGTIGRNELPALYRAADVYVMPSKGEGFGIVYLEALACGTPVIAGDSDGARDPLHDGMLGVLADERHLAAEIQRLLELPFHSGKQSCSDLETGNVIRHYFGRDTFRNLVEVATVRFRNSACSESALGF
jgi:phosphatidylinositol alpha-1,6-mannosyltransferase